MGNITACYHQQFLLLSKQYYMRTFFCSFVLCLVLGASPLHAQVDPQWFLYPTAEIGFWYPDNWTLEEQEQVVRVQHTASGLSVTFTVLEDTQMEEALQDLESLVTHQLQETAWSRSPDLIELNGIMGVGAELEGKIEGRAVQMGLFLLERSQQVVLVVGLGDATVLQEHRASLDKILQSIRPI